MPRRVCVGLGTPRHGVPLRPDLDAMIHDMREDGDVRPDGSQWLNEQFYEARPWAYFERRLVHLAVVVRRPQALRSIVADGIDIGPLLIGAAPASADDLGARDDLRFEAAEGEVLLHHVAETLLRLVHAHKSKSAVAPPCPWLELSRMRDFAAFKRWLAEVAAADAASPDSRELVRTCFGDDGRTDRLDVIHQYLRQFAEHLLVPEPYNAAKHGFALQGERSQLTVDADVAGQPGHRVLDVTGPSVSWLGTRRNATGTPRWAMSTRWYSMEALMGLVWLAIRLIEALWDVARHRYLGAPLERVFMPAPLAELYAALDVDDVRLLETHMQLRHVGD
jgi:hypothetical protein